MRLLYFLQINFFNIILHIKKPETSLPVPG